MRMRPAPSRFAVAGLVVVALAGVTLLVTRAGSHAAAPSTGPPIVLHGTFRPVRSGVYGVLASGDYVLSTVGDGLAQGPVVTDDRTGVTTPLYQGCYVVGIGDPWLLMGCPEGASGAGGYGLQLYSLPTEARQPVSDNPNLPFSPCNDEFLPCAFADGVGAQWIRFDARCEQCQDRFYYENIETAQVRLDPASSTTFADLDSSDLTRSTCSGVRVLAQTRDGHPSWGSLTVYGSVALATGDDAEGREAVYLERCGTRTRRLLTTAPAPGTPPAVASSPQSIVWQSSPRALSGLLLPSLRPFTLPLPGPILAAEDASAAGAPDGRVVQLALTSRALYVLDGDGGRLWRTSAPRDPRVARSSRPAAQ